MKPKTMILILLADVVGILIGLVMFFIMQMGKLSILPILVATVFQGLFLVMDKMSSQNRP